MQKEVNTPRAQQAYVLMIGVMLGVLLMFAVQAMLECSTRFADRDDMGVVRFRTRWSSPPSCIVETSETQFRYYCIGQ